MRLEPARLPDALHGGVADVHLLGHRAHTPVRGIGRPFLYGLSEDLEPELLTDWFLAGPLPLSLVFEKALDAGLHVARPPAPDTRLGGARFPHDCISAKATPGGEYDTCPRGNLLCCVA